MFSSKFKAVILNNVPKYHLGYLNHRGKMILILELFFFGLPLTFGQKEASAKSMSVSDYQPLVCDPFGNPLSPKIFTLGFITVAKLVMTWQ